MRRSSLLHAAVAFAAAAGLASSPAVTEVANKASVSLNQRGRHASIIIDDWAGTHTKRRQRRSGPGWTNRHAQRVAAKKRAIARHRARGKGRRQ